ncbi:hypothetical protein E4U42_004260 [Claviceps africana]|uniref:Ubiquitin-like protease family profile domain-containing protein n=1 Tax=Claviceps africana TaxID=83212 RepID=A0A8K0JEP1_9HYPO|nr:hypothetical protein E4U42_004260 [Claviceps africana]
MTPHPFNWPFYFPLLPPRALGRVVHFAQRTLEAVSSSLEVEGQDSSIGEVTDFTSENLENGRSGDRADRDNDTSRDSVLATVNEGDAVDAIPETPSSRNSNLSQDVTGARLINEPESLGLERLPVNVSDTFAANGKLIKCANRPRNPRRPWLPRFPNIRTRTRTLVCNIPSDEPRQRPRLRSFPKQAFLIDTTYPRLEPWDSRQIEIQRVLRSVRSRRQQVFPNPTQPAPPQPVPNNVPLFVEVNATCTKKRRAEDSEVDLVAALHGAQNENLASRVTISRSSITPNSELEYQEKFQQHMFDLQPVYSGIAGMMSHVISNLSDLGDRFRRYLLNQPYTVSETTSYVTLPLSKGLHVASKRRKIASAESEFEWLDRDELNLLVSRYHHFRDCFQRICIIVQQCPSRAKINKILRPLLTVLADNDSDLFKLEFGMKGYDLSALFLLFCQRMFAFLDTVYEISSFIKVKDKHVTVPKTFQYPISSETLQTVIRAKNLTSSPALLHVLRSILREGGEAVVGYPLPIDILGYVTLDMAAVEHNIMIPSYIRFNYFHQKLIEEFLPNLRTKSFDKVPGTYPRGPTTASASSDATRDTEVDRPDLSCADSPSSPPPRIAEADRTKCGYLKCRIVADATCKLTPSGFRARFHDGDDTYEPIKASYITDFVAKRPLKDHEIRSVKSILKDRRTPKRLTMRLAPKSVRFTESTLSPRQRTHVGLDVPKPRPANDESIDEKGLVQGGQTEVASQDDFGPLEPSRFRYDANGSKSIFPRNRPFLIQKHGDDDMDPSAAIDKILSLPSFPSLAISDAAKAKIALKKEKAAQKVAEEAKRRAEERIRQEREERLARSGGLRIPDQPLVSPLSSDWLSRVEATLRANTSTTLATTAEGVELRRHDFAKVVQHTEWLNDEIVNGSLNWLDQFVNTAAGIKDPKKSTRKCLAMSSFFFKRLQEQGVTRTQRTLRRYGVDKDNLLDIDTILLPICEHSHWTLVVIRPTKRTVAHMDSLNPIGSRRYIDLGLAWLKDMLGEKFVDDEWKVVLHEAPKQTNGHDCGVHTITNGMCLALGLSPIDSYAAEDMPHQRLRIASMLLNGGFKGDFDLCLH